MNIIETLMVSMYIRLRTQRMVQYQQEQPHNVRTDLTALV
jgi:hypothetical protein